MEAGEVKDLCSSTARTEGRVRRRRREAVREKLQAVADEVLEEVAVFVACCIEADCFGRKYLRHTRGMRVAETVVDAYVAEYDYLFDE